MQCKVLKSHVLIENLGQHPLIEDLYVNAVGGEQLCDLSQLSDSALEHMNYLTPINVVRASRPEHDHHYLFFSNWQLLPQLASRETLLKCYVIIYKDLSEELMMELAWLSELSRYANSPNKDRCYAELKQLLEMAPQGVGSSFMIPRTRENAVVTKTQLLTGATRSAVRHQLAAISKLNKPTELEQIFRG